MYPFLNSIPSWLAVLLLAMSPVSELRGAIPLAIQVYGYSAWEAYILGITGNLIPVVPLLLFLEPISRYMMKLSWGDKFFTWLFTRTERKYIRDHESFGLTALALFVAVPMPVTGAWTGCAVAMLLGFPFRKAFPAIALGVLIAGAIVTASVIGVRSLLF